jgi:hypothetical protein
MIQKRSAAIALVLLVTNAAAQEGRIINNGGGLSEIPPPPPQPPRAPIGGGGGGLSVVPPPPRAPIGPPEAPPPRAPLGGGRNGPPRLLPGGDMEGFALAENTAPGTKVYTLRSVNSPHFISIKFCSRISLSVKVDLFFLCIPNVPIYPCMSVLYLPSQYLSYLRVYTSSIYC